jgi:hypothetical protein
VRAAVRAKELVFECAAVEVRSAFVAQYVGRAGGPLPARTASAGCTDDAALNAAAASSTIAQDTVALM